ncbi:hypothetical protein V6N11_052203 [Hibiscus sabdariffa]|uniref:Uncharacterized protein n=1 Tax=Hibiscus sabdariffa TaxID=183260 RepID=A0ABR2U9R3_9ROSI
MCALIWIKAVNETLLLNDGNWWNNPLKSIVSSSPVASLAWIPPEAGTVKFDVDGGCNLKADGCGGIFRSNMGMYELFFSGVQGREYHSKGPRRCVP